MEEPHFTGSLSKLQMQIYAIYHKIKNIIQKIIAIIHI